MKASEEVLAMIALFAPYAANTNATRLLFQQIEALERVADAARKYIDTDATDRRFREEVLSNALDALESKR